MTLLTSAELKLAEKVAWRIGSKWAGVDVEDVRSHLYLWLVENSDAVTRWRSETGDGKLYVSLRREAAKFCARELSTSLGASLNDGNFYSVELVERALPFIFEETPQTSVSVNPLTGEAVSTPADPNLALVIMTDIRQQFYGLARDIRELLEWRFRDGLTFEEIGELRDVTKDGAKKQVSRAVRRLVDALAGETPRL